MKLLQSIIPIIFSLAISSCANLGSYNIVESDVVQKTDGGYTLRLGGHTQHIQPISAEGFFPKQSIYYTIDLLGPGEDLTYRNQPGFYYSFPEDISSNKKHWDFGYAWVDLNREFIYLNFYWIDSPNSVKESRVNGKYKIEN
jgi:hypothetical protein